MRSAISFGDASASFQVRPSHGRITAQFHIPPDKVDRVRLGVANDRAPLQSDLRHHQGFWKVTFSSHLGRFNVEVIHIATSQVQL